MMDAYAIVSVPLLLTTFGLFFALQFTYQCVIMRRGMPGFHEAVLDTLHQSSAAFVLFAMGNTFWRIL